MLNIPAQYIENLLAPMMSAQIFLAVLIYLTIARKRISANYGLYVCFLVTFILFLVGRTVQEFIGTWVWQPILYFRMTLLFSVGIPSLLVAMTLQSGLKATRLLYVFPYVAGLVISLLYVAVMDASKDSLFFTPESIAFLPLAPTIESGRSVVFYGALGCLVIPSLVLIVKEWTGGRSRTLFAFLVGVLIYGVLMIIGMMTERNATIYYTGSIITAICWAWAVFYDIRDMKGKSALLKEELQYLVLSGKQQDRPQIEELLNSLEELSKGNLEVYKIRIREILSMLTDVTISAGGDTDALIERNKEQNRAIESSGDPVAIREIVQAEAVELSAMIAEIPAQRSNVVVEKAKQYIDEHFCEEINVESVADYLELSKAHFMREFKKSTGQTVNQYMTDKRIARAKELLGELNVTETAFEVGYNNSNYFSTVFKKHTGVTPNQFKKQLSDGMN